MYIFYF